jgi:transcription elongation factor GreA
MNTQAYLTADGLIKFKNELEQLRTVKRKEIARRIQEAKELGDLSENAEYSEAKNEQAFVEGRIAELEAIVKNAVIISDTKKGETISIGSTFTVRLEGDLTKQFRIVGSNEVEPSQGKISNESPLGLAFLGHRVNDVVTIVLPKGTSQATIVSIE